MSLLGLKTLLLDTQTTGTSAARDRLLELGWACTSAEESYPPQVSSLLLTQPSPLPGKVQEITGITPEELRLAKDPNAAWEDFHASVAACEATVAVAHYAQFERPFLQKFYEEQGEGNLFPLPLLCTYKIAQRLFPEAPSRNIRGLAGYLGCEISQLRRSADHVLATALIWRKVAAELDALGVKDLASLTQWLGKKPTPREKTNRTQFRVDRLKRLGLPKGPGIYRMLSKTGEILYVGKATSLRDRVNSYFRGGCAGDSRKLEMLARVYDVETQECGTPLEAALLENEEIKRHHPHYNRALKPSPRALVFFSRDLSSVSLVQGEEHPLGPFRENSALSQVFEFLRGLREGGITHVFFELVTEEGLKEGFALFLAEESFDAGDPPGTRELLAWGMRRLREQRKLMALLKAEEEHLDSEAEVEDDQEKEEAEIPEPVRVAAGFRSLLQGAAQELRRSRRLSRLLNASVSWETESGEWRTLRVRHGRVEPGEGELTEKAEYPWVGLQGEHYDRISVLLSELGRRAHRID